MEDNKIKVKVTIKGSTEQLSKVLRRISRELHEKFGEEIDLLLIGECDK